MSQSSAVYPANVYGADNRQQIATILQSMGFETDDIAKAFNTFEKTYGDKKYDISVLTEIVFQVQSGQHSKDDDNNNMQQARTATTRSRHTVPANRNPEFG